MLDTVASLAIEPEFHGFVLLALFLYGLIFFLTEGYVRSDKAGRSIEFLTSAAFILICVFWGALNGERQLLLDKSMPFQGISGGASVRLIDVRSVRGWLEGEPDRSDEKAVVKHGDHRVNAGYGPVIFDRIFELMNLPYSGRSVVGMSQLEWERFLRGLRDSDRLQIGRIPFAVVEVRVGDGPATRFTLFKNDSATLSTPKDGKVAVLCVRNIFNVPDNFSFERESIMLSYGRSRCR
jgi:hypothetical protein